MNIFFDININYFIEITTSTVFKMLKITFIITLEKVKSSVFGLSIPQEFKLINKMDLSISIFQFLIF